MWRQQANAALLPVSPLTLLLLPLQASKTAGKGIEFYGPNRAK